MIRPLAAAVRFIRILRKALAGERERIPGAQASAEESPRSISRESTDAEMSGETAREADAEGGTVPFPEISEYPIDGVLDLHTFRPKDVPSLLDEWLRECSARGILSVRIIHGKGTGAMKARVESILRKHPLAASFRTAGEDGGGWGATLAELYSTGDAGCGGSGARAQDRKKS